MGATVLLIGDDDLLGRALERVLVAEGYVVSRGGHASTATRPALVVLGPCTHRRSWLARPELLAGLEDLPLVVMECGPAVQERLAGWRGSRVYLSQPFGGGQFLAAIGAQLAAASARPRAVALGGEAAAG